MAATKKILTMSFNWEQDMMKNMFVLAALKDSWGSEQHAVTLFQDWIFNCNELFALRLNKCNLNMCTWDVKDGMIIDD